MPARLAPAQTAAAQTMPRHTAAHTRVLSAGMFAVAPAHHLSSRDCLLRRSSHGGREAALPPRPERRAFRAATSMTAAAQSGAAALPVRPGERRWTEAELAKVRDALAAEAAELRADIDRSESDIASRLGDAVGDAGDDQADVGAKTFEREHELALTHNARELLAQTERALARIDAGTYGTCESCGEPIGKARLQAFPRAVLCVSCKQREERR
jgi:DnaK suppressor protein